jgi:polyphosphate glucokinase
MDMNFFGIDIGCTSIKHGLVSFGQEIIVKEFGSIFIPEASKSGQFTQALESLLQNTSTFTAVGVGFPSTVRNNAILNLSIEFNDIWSGVCTLLKTHNTPCFAINDADAAGIAEVYRNDAAALRKGVTIVITLGTGIGSAIFLDGKLIPNTEIGLIEMHGMTAEKYTAGSGKTKESLSLPEWAARLQEYLTKIEVVLKPDSLILGGGISAEFEEYSSLLKTRAQLLPAFYRNQAGVIGAAIHASLQMNLYKLPG